MTTQLRILSVALSRFGVASLLTFAVDMASFNLLFLFGSTALISHVFSVLIAVAFSYFLMDLWVFPRFAAVAHGRQIKTFMIINILALATSSLIIFASEKFFGIDDQVIFANLVKVSAIGFTAILKFLAYRSFTFLR